MNEEKKEEVEIIQKTYRMSEAGFKQKMNIPTEETITSVKCGGLFHKGEVRIHVELKK